MYVLFLHLSVFTFNLLAILAQFLGERLAHLKIPVGWLIMAVAVVLAIGWGVMHIL